jgi:hypothetical protein
MHGRKLTKDAIEVVSQAANPRRTKSWLDSGLVQYLTVRDRRHLSSDTHDISPSLEDNRKDISFWDYGQSPAEAKKTGPWQIGHWAFGRG